MKRHLLSFMLPLFALAACEKPFEEQEIPQSQTESSLEFTATMEQIGAGTKTTIDSQNNVLWQAGDEIAVYNKNQKPDKYLLESGDNTTNARFSLLEEAEGKNPEEKYGYNLAVYPYTNLKLRPRPEENGDVYSYELYYTIPFEQQYVKDGIDKNALAMAAVSEGSHLKFRNLAGVFKFQFTGTQKVKRIEVNTETYITGKFATYDYDVASSISCIIIPQSITSEAQKVVLNCPGEGVQLSSEPTSFYLVVAPTDLHQGFTAKIEFTDGTYKEVRAGASKNNKVDQNSILSMPVIEIQASKKQPKHELWIKTVDNVKPDLSGKNLNIISEQVNSKGYWEVTDLTGVATDFVTLENCSFENQPIQEILFPDGYVYQIPYACFRNCKSLTRIDLSNTEIDKILSNAFEGCTKLTSINLPTTPGLKIDSECFRESGLHTLTIPANANTTELSDVFWGCTSLTSITVKSSVFASSWGDGLFYQCPALKEFKFLAKDIELKKPDDAEIKVFEEVNTAECDLVLNAECKELPTEVINSDKLSWKGFLWNSISYVDDNENPVKGPDPIRIPHYDIDGIHQDNELWVKTIDGLSPDTGMTGETLDFMISHKANEKGYWVYTYNKELPMNLQDGNFYENNKIIEVVLPDNIESLGYQTFYGCQNLSKIVFPTTQMSVSSWSTFYKNGFTSITIPKNVKFDQYSNYSFQDCAKLEEAIILTSTFKASNAFSGCTNLKKLSFLAETLDINGKYLFQGLTTTGIDLVINEKCSVPADGLTWAGKTWKSITKVTVDAEGNIIP